MNQVKLRFDPHKAQKESWRMLRGDIPLDMDYLIELVDVHPAAYLPKVNPRQLEGLMGNYIYCQACGDVLAVEECVTCLGLGLAGCSECDGWGGLAYCPNCDGEDDDDDDLARL